jgi:archaellum biogenesis protein FlaJ (TadC family)
MVVRVQLKQEDGNLMFLIMHKLINYLQLICILATLTNAGLLIYISIFIHRDPFWYLTVSGSAIQNKLYNYSFPLGLLSFIVSMILYFIYKKKFSLRFYLLIAPTIIWLIYLIIFISILIEKH